MTCVPTSIQTSSFSCTTILYMGLYVVLGMGCSPIHKIPNKPDAWLEKQVLSSQDIPVLLAIIAEMEQRRIPDFIPELLKLTNHTEKEIRIASFEALNAYSPSLDDDRRDKAYLQGLTDKDVSVVQVAQRGIQQRISSGVNTQFLVNSLIQTCVSTSNWKEQLHILESLQFVAGTEVDDLFLRMSTSASNPAVRKLSIAGIASRKLHHAKDTLYQIKTTDTSPEVREAAALALQQLGGKITNIVVAVMPFEVQGSDPQSLQVGFQNYLSGSLSSAGVATVVERGQVDKVMAELIYQDSFIDDNKAISIGKSLRASQVISGNMQLYENHVTITVKRIDVESQEIISSAQVSGLQVDFDALQQQVVQQFIERF